MQELGIRRHERRFPRSLSRHRFALNVDRNIWIICAWNGTYSLILQHCLVKAGRQPASGTAKQFDPAASGGTVPYTRPDLLWLSGILERTLFRGTP